MNYIKDINHALEAVGAAIEDLQACKERIGTALAEYLAEDERIKRELATVDQVPELPDYKGDCGICHGPMLQDDQKLKELDGELVHEDCFNVGDAK